MEDSLHFGKHWPDGLENAFLRFSLSLRHTIQSEQGGGVPLEAPQRSAKASTSPSPQMLFPSHVPFSVLYLVKVETLFNNTGKKIRRDQLHNQETPGQMEENLSSSAKG